MPWPPHPPADDLKAWQAARTFVECSTLERFGSGPRSSSAEKVEIDGVTIYVVTPHDLPHATKDRIFINMHGGALFYGGGEACRLFGQLAAETLKVRTYAVDYRMPPEYPYPAGLDDCLAVYKNLLKRYAPELIAIGGASAGGNLATALVLRARDEGLPLPAMLALMTPEVDLTESGDSFEVNRDADVTLQPLLSLNRIYADKADLAHPYVSPLFGDFTKGFPPTFVQSGTRDLFLSNAARLHQALHAAGVSVELHVFEGRPHAGFNGAPEDKQVGAVWADFVSRHWR